MLSAMAELSLLRIAIGADRKAVFKVGLPVLDGEPVEDLFPSASVGGRSGSLTLFKTADWLLGVASVALPEGLEEAARRVYLDIFQATRGLQLARIWNYVPAINESGPGNLENYRLFCRGRSLAFEGHHGSAFKKLLPSASAVGCAPHTLTVLFAASVQTPRHVENPLQVPAYEYPQEHGPRAPSFARATIVPGKEDATVFISGTAAIRGHATVGPDNLSSQLDCTLENLREISHACGLASPLDLSGSSVRHFKVYVRTPSDVTAIAGRLKRDLLKPDDRVSYLQADICRTPLLVEIEATLFGVKF
jgi:chorismate lyase/3-hydroxybenzoate synthase